jgi:glutaredoxin
MYANKHCPLCQKARRWLLEQKIPYVEKDIQQDRAAAGELMAKGKAQGIPVTGVPVFDVGGKLIPGFDKATIRKVWAAAKPAAGTQGII